jgi:phosphotransferase family enzyme
MNRSRRKGARSREYRRRAASASANEGVCLGYTRAARSRLVGCRGRPGTTARPRSSAIAPLRGLVLNNRPNGARPVPLPRCRLARQRAAGAGPPLPRRGAHACLQPRTMTPVHREKAAPPEGCAWQPRQRWNDIRWDGEAVVKRITRDDARRRCDAEVAILTRLAGVVPLPRAFASEDPFAVRMEYVLGPLAEQWFVSGLNALGLDEAVRRQAVFLRGCGEILRDLHSVDPRSFVDVLTGAGASVIHATPDRTT